MRSKFILLVLALFLPTTALSQVNAIPALPAPAAPEQTCAGRDLMQDLPADQRASVDAAVDAAPYPRGNHWLAVKGDARVHIVGTFHLFDPRMTARMRKLMPVLHAADAIYLEATGKEFDQLRDALAAQPELMFTKGATLPERLTAAEWTKLAAEMEARGIPAFLASKFQPWYISVLLGVPPCAMSQMSATTSGMDHLIMEAADQMHVPTRALEPYDTAFRAFAGMSDAEQLELIRASLPLTDQTEDMFATMTESYFHEEHRQIWELSRQLALHAPGADPARIARDFAMMEDSLISARNRAWMDVIVPAAQGRTIVVAVGAGHLSGETGLLELLAQAGFQLSRQDF